jgi:hypothetical protein
MPQTTAIHIVIWFSIATGAVLCAIGLRFLVLPEIAAEFFGIDQRMPGIAPHAAIALRDLWLGLLLITFAVFQKWQEIAIWLGIGALVCLGDASIAMMSSGRWVSVSFHVASGVFCAWLAIAAWRLHDSSIHTSDGG